MPHKTRHYVKTRQVMVGDIPLGGDAPCVVQSMLSVSPEDVEENLHQIARLKDAGCEIVRIAIPKREYLHVFERICKESELPVVADVHFDHIIALEAAQRGAAKLRINPGNIGGLQKTELVFEAARAAGIPIRIGVNAGSLDTNIAKRTDISISEKLALSARQYVDFAHEVGFNDIVVSAKAHDVPTTIEAYRLIKKDMPQIPLHIGITEAGTLLQGVVKSAAGLGILLYEGIGDTLRISLTDDPVQEVRASWMLLNALNIRKRGPEIISCPTCGRCNVDLISMAQEVEERISHINKPLRVAVMGCAVNGPGEAKDADIGVASADGYGIIFKHGKAFRRANEKDIVSALVQEIENM
ncbi:MAG: flavodoxin-dependent (E)-4-hydroxy-3-methylbut-2-enyl-diphosphate synthase [Eggerthellaceae bacterium]|nr:flavodoxin-dependent (E)-4-hydroxy-3-methylbut-2-enyl-diphosphate synthase [Eggerthellaceae bacterium]